MGAISAGLGGYDDDNWRVNVARPLSALVVANGFLPLPLLALALLLLLLLLLLSALGCS